MPQLREQGSQMVWFKSQRQCSQPADPATSGVTCHDSPQGTDLTDGVALHWTWGLGIINRNPINKPVQKSAYLRVGRLEIAFGHFCKTAFVK